MLMVIIKKELKRVFSDRRLVFSAFILPAVSIYILYSLMGSMIGNLSDDMDDHVASVAIVNSSESFKTYVKDYNTSMDEAYSQQGENFNGFRMKANFVDDDLDQLKMDIKSGDLDVLIVFEDGFDESVKEFSNQQHPNINTFYNPSEEYSMTALNRVEGRVLFNYQNQLLGERFGGLEALTAFTLNVDNADNTIAEEGKEAGMGMSFMLPMLLNIMLFAGAMGIGIDVIAGEKERGTMATMLLAPVDREVIAFGKVISLGIVATLSAMCTFGAIIASLPNASEFLAAGAEVSLTSLAFTPIHYVMLLVILIMQVGIFVAAICLVSVIAKSVKEAGTYISPIYMLVMVSAFATIFTTGDVELYKFSIPVLGNVFAIKEIFTFDLSITEFGVTVGVSALIIAVLLKLVTIAFNNERIMFNS